jgi:predicted ArsR family transcriptional regulator
VRRPAAERAEAIITHGNDRGPSESREAAMGGDLWTEGRAILTALKKKEDAGVREVRSDELATELGMSEDELLRHIEHLVKAGYAACHSELGSRQCFASLTDVGRAAI